MDALFSFIVVLIFVVFILVIVAMVSDDDDKLGSLLEKFVFGIGSVIFFLFKLCISIIVIVYVIYLFFSFVFWLFSGENTTKYTDTEIEVIKENSELKGFDRGYYAGRRDGKVIICNEIYKEENKPSSCTYTD